MPIDTTYNLILASPNSCGDGERRTSACRFPKAPGGNLGGDVATLSAAIAGCDTTKAQPFLDLFSGDAYQSFSSFWDFSAKLVVLRQSIVIAAAPFHLVNIVKNALGLKSANKEKRIDKALDIADSARCIGEGSGVLLANLSKVGVVSSKFSWTGPLGVALTVLSVPSIIKHYRTIRRGFALSKDFEQAEKSGRVNGTLTQKSLEGILSILKEIHKKDEDFVSAMFDVDEDKLTKALDARQQKIGDMLASSDPCHKNKGKELLETTVNTLKGRVRKSIFSSILGILASTINLIGTAILLACPVCPLGWALVGLGGLIDTARMINNYVVGRRFKGELGIV